MRMINADDLEQALREAGLAEIIKVDCSKCTSAWGVPIVDAEPVRHGRWIDMGDFEQCSACQGTHLKEFQSYYGKVLWLRTPYCPECGAKMDGVGYEYRRKARACHEE